MAQAPLSKPRLFSSPDPAFLQTLAQTDGTNTFQSQQFLTLASGALRQTAATDTQVYGLSLDPSHASADEPYTQPFGETHNLVQVNDGQLYLMNLAGATATSGTGGAQSSVTVGGRYNLSTPGSGIMANLQCINTASSSATGAFQISALYDSGTYPDGDANTDTNGRVLVRVVGTQA